MPEYLTTYPSELSAGCCSVCGALVVDQAQHTEWHRDLVLLPQSSWE